MLTVTQVLIATFIAGLVTFFTRVMPFLFFSKQKPPAWVIYIQQYIPPMTMVILVLYCVKNVNWGTAPHGLPVMAGIAAAALLHIWKSNALVSIFGATAFYMVLLRVI